MAYEFQYALAQERSLEAISVSPRSIPTPVYNRICTEPVNAEKGLRAPSCFTQFCCEEGKVSCAKEVRLPMGRIYQGFGARCVWQPFAEMGKKRLELEGFNAARCHFCKAYVSSFTHYSPDTNKFRCHLCSNEQLFTGRTFPYIPTGSYEVIAPAEFGIADERLNYAILMIDTQDEDCLNIAKGLILKVLKEAETLETNICIVTFGAEVCYYQLTRNSHCEYKCEYLTEMWSPVAPLSLFTPINSATAPLIMDVLAHIKHRLVSSPISSVPVINQCNSILEAVGGGKISLFTKCVESPPALLTTSNAIDLYICRKTNNAHIVAQWLGFVRNTGGKGCYCADESSMEKGSEKLQERLKKEEVREALARVRCCEGLRLVDVKGPGTINDSIISIHSLTREDCFSLLFEVTGKYTILRLRNELSAQIALVYSYKGERVLRIYTVRFPVAENLSINYSDEFTAFLDPESLAYSLLQSSLLQPEPSRSLYLSLFDFIGQITGDNIYPDLPRSLLLLAVYCHCASRRFTIAPIGALVEVWGMGLCSWVLYMYPGIYSCREIVKKGLGYAQIRCSRDNIHDDDAYIVQVGPSVLLYQGNISPEVVSQALSIAAESIPTSSMKQITSSEFRLCLCEDAELSACSLSTFLSDLLTTLSRTVFSYSGFSLSRLSASTKKLSACRKSSHSCLYIMLGISATGSSSSNASNDSSSREKSLSFPRFLAV